MSCRPSGGGADRDRFRDLFHTVGKLLHAPAQAAKAAAAAKGAEAAGGAGDAARWWEQEQENARAACDNSAVGGTADAAAAAAATSKAVLGGAPPERLLAESSLDEAPRTRPPARPGGRPPPARRVTAPSRLPLCPSGPRALLFAAKLLAALWRHRGRGARRRRDVRRRAPRGIVPHTALGLARGHAILRILPVHSWVVLFIDIFNY